MVHGTVVQESHNQEVEILLSRHLVAKSWDSTEEVLGQYGLGTVVLGRSWDSAVLGQSWDSAVLGRSWDSAVLGQYSRGTVQSWDSDLGRVVMGQYSLVTVVLGQWSWDSGLGTMVLGQYSLGTVVLGQ